MRRGQRRHLLCADGISSIYDIPHISHSRSSTTGIPTTSAFEAWHRDFTRGIARSTAVHRLGKAEAFHSLVGVIDGSTVTRSLETVCQSRLRSVKVLVMVAADLAALTKTDYWL